jgi:hypothetical protein
VHNPEFWLRYVVYIAISEPAIKHAILGLTALHERFRAKQSLELLEKDTAYALRHYTKAISILTGSIKTGSMIFSDTPLVACILFCAYESISYHLHSAISHAGSGIKLLTEREGSLKTPKQCSIPAFVLSPLYMTLDTQGLELGETSFVYQTQLQGHITNKLPSFKNIEEAQRRFDELTNAILHAIYDVDSERTSDPHASDGERSISWCTLHDLVHGYRQWCDAFDTFVLHGATSDTILPCLLLQVWRVLVMINLCVDLQHGEMGFDRFDNEFQAITDLCFAFVLIYIRTPAESRLQDSAAPAVLSARRHELRNAQANASSMRGGYLGIHPHCTPFVSGDIFDTQTLQRTTEYLLQISRPLCQDEAKSTIEADHSSMVLCDLDPSFCFSPGIVSPLYVTISRCRDGGLRRKALALMQRCKRREGLWDSDLAARLGQRVIEIEEQRAKELRGATFESSSAFDHRVDVLTANQVPNEARVRMIKPTFLPDRRSIERYYLGWTATSDDLDEVQETWIEEIMEW